MPEQVTKDPGALKRAVLRLPKFEVGDITAHWPSVTLLEIRERRDSSQHVLLDVEEVRALRDWLNKVEL